MGENLVPENMRQEVRAALENVHETFSREITIFKRKTESFVATTDSTYNALYSRLKNQQGGLSKVSQTKIKARIDYIDRQERAPIAGLNAQVNVPLPDGSVRLKIDEAGYKILKQSSSVEIDGRLYELMSDSAKTGPFSVQYFIMYFKRKD
jgi:hypothetical protein|tara:strand:- start:1 stop:453 length:453 start_codon:yes stop_codon:yes gene_type:complete